MLTCPKCGGTVGEEACVGCQMQVVAYRCSWCGATVPNPRYKTYLQCPKCQKYVTVDPSKSNWHLIRAYICQNCGATVKNTAWTNDPSCAGCAPQRCVKCQEILAVSSILNYKKCPKCGKKYYIESQ